MGRADLAQCVDQGRCSQGVDDVYRKASPSDWHFDATRDAEGRGSVEGEYVDGCRQIALGGAHCRDCAPVARSFELVESAPVIRKI